MRRPIVQTVGRWASGVLGRDSMPVRILRPAYERLLDLVTGGRGFVRVLNGCERIYVHPRWRGFVPETYEPAVFHYLRAAVRPGDVCINVGAHVGIYAMCLARWSQPGGRVYAFEPNPLTCAVLEDHVRRNALQQTVTVERVAVGAQPGTAAFYAASLAGFSRLGGPNPAREELHQRIDVPVTTLDLVCERLGLSPGCIVMDIEGFEVAALSGARRTILAGAGQLRLVIELHPTLWAASNSSREQLEALLGDLRLRPVSLTGQRDALSEAGVVALEYC